MAEAVATTSWDRLAGQKRRLAGVLTAGVLVGTLGSAGDLLASQVSVSDVEVAPADTTTTSPQQGHSLGQVAQAIGAQGLYRDGLTGAGVGVALIDTGVAEVDGLSGTRLRQGPDFASAEQGFDAVGHGTHLAGIIAGSGDEISGIAPGASLLAVKAANSQGETDPADVADAVHWVVDHREEHGVRVLNLAFAAESLAEGSDPLIAAVERAVRAGIVVVTAAGNDGAQAESLGSPATSRMVLTVGGLDMRGTAATADDMVGDYSSVGSTERHPDLVAPGTSIVSLRAPGSEAAVENPGSHVGAEGIKGTGTSQSAAVVTGAVALLLEQHPELGPADVKRVLAGTARTLQDVSPAVQGAGALDLEAASAALDSGDWRRHTWRRHTWRDADWERHTWRRHTWRDAEWERHTWRRHTWRDADWERHTWRRHTWRDADWERHTWR